MLTEEQVKKWCEALRSGEYKQSSNRLQDYYGHCCLGVACEVLKDPETLIRDNEGYLLGEMLRYQNFVELENFINNFKFMCCSLPQLNDGTFHLVDVNSNSLRLNFNEIADIIEAVSIHKVLA